MFNKINKLLVVISLVLILLAVIPSSFAINEDSSLNETEFVSISNYSPEPLEATYYYDYYLDASAESDGDGTINNPYKTLTANIIRSNSNIHLANGEYTLDKKKDISNVNFIGSDPEKTIIKFNGYGFNIQSTIFLQNLTLTDLAIINNYRLSATNTIFTQSTGSSIDYYGNNFGGAIYTPLNNYYATLVNLTNCTFKDNYAEYGGAIYLESGNLYLNDCKFINNTAHNYGGAIALEYDSKVTIKKSEFINNYAQNNAGGAIYLRNSELIGENIEITNCSATFGAGITSLSSNVNLNSVKGKNNAVKYDGGFIYQMYGKLSIVSSSFNNNSALNGGAIFVDNTTSLIIITTSFTNNKANLTAGAVYSLLNKLNRGNSIKDMSLGNTFENNTASSKQDAYESDLIELNIGNGDYVLYYVNTTEITIIPSKYSLIDENNNPIAGKEIVFELNGESYLATTDINGIASININLKVGTYEINAKFKGDEEYFPTNTIGIINVKNKVEITIDISKNSNNAIIYIKLSKSLDESLLVKINDEEYIINTVNGRAIINLDNLENGNYFIVAKLINEEEYITNSSNNEFEINLKSLEIISQNMTMADYSNEMYSITLLDSENNPIANKIVVFNINSERYVRTTDINGIASIPINLKPGVYDIQTMFSGDDEFFKNNATNTIVVKEGSTIKDIVIKNNTHDVSIEITLNKQLMKKLTSKSMTNNIPS